MTSNSGRLMLLFKMCCSLSPSSFNLNIPRDIIFFPSQQQHLKRPRVLWRRSDQLPQRHVRKIILIDFSLVFNRWQRHYVDSL
jgi:hypothetical protein